MWKTIPENEVNEFNTKGYVSTYGELTYEGLEYILNKVGNKTDKVFVDLGSGLGNVTINALKIFPKFSHVFGIELSNTRYNESIKLLSKQKKGIKNTVKFFNKDILDDGFNYGDFDIIYISNLCFPDKVNNLLSEKIVNECIPGTHIFCSKPLMNIKTCEPHFNVIQTWSSRGTIHHYII